MDTGGVSKPLNDANFGVESLQRELDGLKTPGNESNDCDADLKMSGISGRASGISCDANKTGKDYEEYLRVAGGDEFADNGTGSIPIRDACLPLQEEARPWSGTGTGTKKAGKDYEEHLRMADGDQMADSGNGTLPIDYNHIVEDECMVRCLLPTPSQGTSSTPTSLPGAFAHGGRSSEPPVQRMSTNHRPVHPVILPGQTIPDCQNTSAPGATDSALDDAGLVEAHPVTDEVFTDPSTLVRASPADENEAAARQLRKNNWKRSFLLILLAMVCVLILAVLIAWWSGAMDTPKDAIDEQYNRTSVADPPTTPEDYLKQYLPGETLRDLENYTSPQYRAFQWLHRDPSLVNYTEARLRQRFALATFFHSTGGNTVWNQSVNWLDYQIHECDWYFTGRFKIFGFEHTATSPCNSLQGMDKDNSTNHTDEESYKLLWLNRNNITGSIPRELYWLTSLESIDLGVNRVHGSIESDHIQALQNLRQLSLPANELTGPIPRGISFLSKLEILYFGRNLLTGTLPMGLAFLSNTLKQLTIHGNNFHGSIPSGLGELSHLTLLGLNSLPFLTGTIPTEWGMLSSLEYIYAFGNPQMTGTIPSEVGLMTSLAWLHLNGCQLTGPLPSTLGNLAPTMKELVLFDNRLTSSLPTELGLLTSVYFFVVGMNDLTGSLPSEFGKLTALQTFDLHMNHLTGTLPPELAALTTLEDFNAAQNDFSGTVPEGYASWPAISMFNATGNPGLQGTLPKAFCFLPQNESMKALPQTKETPISYLLNTSFLDFDCTKTMCGCDCPCLD